MPVPKANMDGLFNKFKLMFHNEPEGQDVKVLCLTLLLRMQLKSFEQFWFITMSNLSINRSINVHCLWLQELLQQEIKDLEGKVSKIQQVLGDLKVQLYAKFGNNINLEADESWVLSPVLDLFVLLSMTINQWL